MLVKTDYTIASELKKLSLCLSVMKCQLKNGPECLLHLITMTVMMSKRLTYGIGSTEFTWVFTKRKDKLKDYEIPTQVIVNKSKRLHASPKRSSCIL